MSRNTRLLVPHPQSYSYAGIYPRPRLSQCALPLHPRRCRPSDSHSPRLSCPSPSRRDFTTVPARFAVRKRIRSSNSLKAFADDLLDGDRHGEYLSLIRRVEQQPNVKKTMTTLRMRPRRAGTFMSIVLEGISRRRTPKELQVIGRGETAELMTKVLSKRYPDEPELLEIWLSDEKFGSLMFVLGDTLLKQPGFAQFGEFVLAFAVELGHVGAAVKMVQLEKEMSTYVAPQRAKAMLKEHAEDGTDWRALVVQAMELVRFETTPTNRKKAYDMARRAFDMTEPSKDVDGDRSQSKLTSWLPLRKLALDSFSRRQLPEDAALAETALADGALKYDDPEACMWYAQSPAVELYSDQWVRLTTKAAMAGLPKSDVYSDKYQPNAADRLGKYYLEKHGWYPCDGNPSESAYAQLGFDWLEVAAYTHVGNPEQMKIPYLKMAVVLRENGRVAEGRKILERARAEIAAAPAEEHLKASACAWLQEFIDGWSGRLPAASRSIELLGEPQMRKVQPA